MYNQSFTEARQSFPGDYESSGDYLSTDNRSNSDRSRAKSGKGTFVVVYITVSGSLELLCTVMKDLDFSSYNNLGPVVS